MKYLKYLAYGSNLHPLRLAERVSSRLLDTIELRGWHLRFHKRGRDGSGKASIVPTDSSSDTVHAALFEIRAAHKWRLDAIEGLGIGYDEVRMPLAGHGEAFAYVASDDYVDEALRPFVWYRRLIVMGARYHAFPHRYVHTIRKHPATEDFDHRRRRHVSRLLRKLRAT